MLQGQRSLDQIASATEASGIDPQPRSGRQERIENLLARKLF